MKTITGIVFCWQHVTQLKFPSLIKDCFPLAVPGAQQWITPNSEICVGSPPACAKIIIRSRMRIHDKIPKYVSHALDHLLLFDLLMFRSETLCEERIIGGREEKFWRHKALVIMFKSWNMTYEVRKAIIRFWWISCESLSWFHQIPYSKHQITAFGIEKKEKEKAGSHKTCQTVLVPWYTSVKTRLLCN